LINSVEKARRKKINVKERAKLLALMGKRAKDEDGAKASDSDSDSDPDDADAPMNADDQSDDSSDSSDEEEDEINQRGTD